VIGELDLYGVFLSPLLGLAVAALAVQHVLRRLLDRLGLYRWVWHRALFDTALYVLVLGGLWAVVS
jgi:Protein of unknown function (DUF1656)